MFNLYYICNTHLIILIWNLRAKNVYYYLKGITINVFLSSPRKITTQLGHEHALIQLTLYCKHCGLQKSVCPFPCSLEFCQYPQSFRGTLTCFFLLKINTTTCKEIVQLSLNSQYIWKLLFCPTCSNSK